MLSHEKSVESLNSAASAKADSSLSAPGKRWMFGQSRRHDTMSIVRRLQRWSIFAVTALALCTPALTERQAAAHEFGEEHPAEVTHPLSPDTRFAPAPGTGLFGLGGPITVGQTSGRHRAFIKRTHTVHMDPNYRDRMIAAAPAASSSGASASGTVEAFSLQLFNDVPVSLYKTGMHQDALGSTIWTGQVVGDPGGEAMLVFRNGQVAGTVRLGKQAFVIEPAGIGGARVIETDPDQRPHTDPLHVPAQEPAQGPAIQPSVPPSSGSLTTVSHAPAIAAGGASPTVINVLVAYTPAAASGVADIQSAISMGISYTNQVLINSGINTQINLVGVMQVNYAENGNGAVAILEDAQAGTGGFAQVQAQRDAQSADLVSVWADFTDACGVAYQLDDADTNPTALEAPYGYNAISLSFGYACLTDGVAHEIGHNLGAAHDRYIDDPQDLLTSRYNFGYVDINDQIRTIMSYPNACTDIGLSCAIVPYHSSPNLTYQGHVLGIADSLPNAADNVRRIGEISPYIAQFRSGGTTTHTLSVASVGMGSVTSSPAGISCGTTCSAAFAAGSTVTLTAAPANGNTFTGWSGGGCSGTGTCTVIMTADTTVTANFTAPPNTHTLTVVIGGSEPGQVLSYPPGSVFCTATCNYTFTAGTTVSLSASLQGGTTFSGWGGACSGTGACSVTLNADMQVTATFIPTPITKTLGVSSGSGTGTGTGTISSSPAGISCASCSAQFPFGEVLTLTATPAAGSVFTGWSGGGCSGTGTCTVTLYTDTYVSAGFRSQNEVTLTVQMVGPGRISSGDDKIICGNGNNTCTAVYAPGSTVFLDPAPIYGTSLFTGWNPASCDSQTDTDIYGFPLCEITLTSNRTATADFRLDSTYDQLTLSTVGGVGSIYASPEICQNNPCTTLLEEPGSQVTLTASPNYGYDFVGWSGGCSGTSTCVVTMNGAVTVTANFTIDPAQSFLLTVAKVGTGTGTLSAGTINCGNVCSARFIDGQGFTINATPAIGSALSGWSYPNCFAGELFCYVPPSSADTTVTATFSYVGTNTVSISKTGSGSGVVTSQAGGISCGATCSTTLTTGSQVVLFASASQGSMFTGWSGGGCSGTFPCAVVLNADTTVAANFLDTTKTSLLTIAKTGTGGGTVTTSPSGISCGSTCTASFVQGLPLTLTATPIAGSTFTGWSGGGCSGNQTCALSLSADTQVTANFMVNNKTSIALAAAILPTSRSVQVGSAATLFGTLINAGPGTATYCGIAPVVSLPMSFTFQTTDPATNLPTGTPNTTVNIPAGAAQSFVLSLTSTFPFGPQDVPLTFSCTNADAAPTYTGINTVQFSASTTPVPDVIAIAGTLTNDGTLHIPGVGSAGAFAVAVANVGSGGTIAAGADTGSANLPVTLTVCQTDPSSGACLAPPALFVQTSLAANATGSFGIFVTANSAIPFQPAANRIFFRLYDTNHTVRGSTSVAVRTP